MNVTGTNILIDRYEYGSTKVWPVDSELLLNHLQMSHSFDDNIIFEIGGYLPAATEEVENRGNVALIRQKRRQTIGEELLDSLSGQSVSLSFGPVITITAIKYLDTDAVEQTMPTANYRLLPDRATVYFYGSIPTLLDGPGTVWIDYEAGYGDTPAEIPSMWQNIICHFAYRRYEYRAGDIGNGSDSWERMIDRLIVAAGGSRRGY